MRTVVIAWSLCLCALLAACAGDNITGVSTFLDLTGSWSWISSRGGIMGETRTPQSVGYTQTIVFRPRLRYEEYRNESLVAVTGYIVSRETTSTPGTVVNVVRYTDERMPQDASIVGRDTLILFDRCMDCYEHRYIRIH